MSNFQIIVVANISNFEELDGYTNCELDDGTGRIMARQWPPSSDVAYRTPTLNKEARREVFQLDEKQAT